MGDIVNTLGSDWVMSMLLVACRVSALLLMTPVLHAVPVPTTVRVVLLLGISVGLSMPFAAHPVDLPEDVGGLVSAMLREAAVGATLGLGILMAFAGFNLAGRLLDVQVGFGLGQVFDPVTRTQVPVLTSIFTLFGVLLFFIVHGHHALLRGIAFSIERFPPGQDWALEAAAGPVLQQAAVLFTLGFALAAPVVTFLLLVEFALGILARNLPQANVFVLGMPIKLASGLLALSLWAAAMNGVTLRIYDEIYRTWTGVFQAMPEPERR
jgi:flagellar biosynthetic protein FliR